MVTELYTRLFFFLRGCSRGTGMAEAVCSGRMGPKRLRNTGSATVLCAFALTGLTCIEDSLSGE